MPCSANFALCRCSLSACVFHFPVYEGLPVRIPRSSQMSNLHSGHQFPLLVSLPTPFLSAQNIQLYAFGVLFNGLGLAVSGALGGGGLTGLTRGYSPVTYLVVANLGFTGLLVSWVMKFADSIMKVRGEKRREEMCDQ